MANGVNQQRPNLYFPKCPDSADVVFSVLPARRFSKNEENRRKSKRNFFICP